MMSPILSIIVPVYKVENYLDDCVQSIIHQTLKNWELILVDDGSPDKCPLICDDYAAKDLRIKVLHIANGGQSRARNKGIEVAKGRFITFVDSDDDIAYNTYKDNIDFMVQHPEIDILQFPQKRIGWGDNFVKQTNVFYKGKKELFLHNYNDLQIDNTIWSKIYKRESIGPIRFREGHLHEDKMFILDLLKNVEVVYISNIGCYNYYKREGSILNTFSYSRLEDWIYTEIETLDYMYEFPELKKEWIPRWMYNVRMLIVEKKKHNDWNIICLLKNINDHRPGITFINVPIKDVVSALFIKVFGIQMYYNLYLWVLKHKQTTL